MIPLHVYFKRSLTSWNIWIFNANTDMQDLKTYNETCNYMSVTFKDNNLSKFFAKY